MGEERPPDGSFGRNGWLGVATGLIGAAGVIAAIAGLGWLINLALPNPTPKSAPSPTATRPWTPPPFPSIAPYTGPVTVCADGWISHSTGRGTCSHHGGER